MEWKKLLSTERQVEVDAAPEFFNSFEKSEFENDYLSIVTSAAFRRLQDKTQVFPLDKSDFVRTRLTHSLEVSSIGRQLGIMLTDPQSKYSKEDFKNAPEVCRDLPIVVSCAGLLHDVGNPPFGHYGEAVIRKWFAEKFEDDSFTYKGYKVGDLLTEQMKSDFTNFEGNAQALRILSKKADKELGFDMNLTYAVMNTLIKYPNDTLHFDHHDPDIKKHKPGYYYAEEKMMRNIAESTGTIVDGEYVRHPLVYLLEAADDIAYATADIEDAMKKGCFILDQFTAYFKKEIEKYAKKIAEIEDEEKRAYEEHALSKTQELYDALVNDYIDDDFRYPTPDLIYFEKWIAYVRKILMYTVTYAFAANYDEIMAGTFNKDLFDDTYSEYTIKIMKSAMAHYAYDTHDVVLIELAAKRIVGTLLDEFVPAALLYKEENEYEPDILDTRVYFILPDELRADFKAHRKDENAEGMSEDERKKAIAENVYRKMLMVTDFISGMTDSYAQNLYREITGV